MGFDIVIVNWNAGELLKKCVESILQANNLNCKLENIIVVDNASSDNSINDISLLDSRVIVIKNKINFGFGKACNIGAKKCINDFIIFINPDIVVNNETFYNLFEYIKNEDKKNIGIYGIQLQYENGDIQFSCARFPSFYNLLWRTIGIDKFHKLFHSYRMDDFNHLESREVDHVMGAFYAIKRDIFCQVLGFDEDYFVYFEDLDLSKRVYNMGFKSKFIVESKAIHSGCGTTQKIKGMRYYYNVSGRLLYSKKHLGYLAFFILYLSSVCIEIILRLFPQIFKLKFNDSKDLLKGYFLILKKISLVNK